ncbi:HepT-like ribonuclease domain-containing protein [Larkinella terrae]|uniref:DUF86 domain-containing protein n=1 Tax=Larkinella terrae TaxID=2025311 RepID=A0A7K0ELD5_9BACT|nr:HepT-like ribonuclease domain-containing protein [Larkinella terrae]MRS62594.1 DUF86 domain-containing protein [Larkinella terrae]
MIDEIRKCLTDILVSIESIDNYLENNRLFEIYQTNKMLRRAIERELEIIGEATNIALRLEPTLSISNARRIVDTRNRIIHAYDAVNDTVVWSIVIKHLPILKMEIVHLLENSND